MRVIFTRIATQDLEDAVRSHELEYSRLGRRFKEEVRKAALRVAGYPNAWSMERGEAKFWNVRPSAQSCQNPYRET